MAGQSNMEGFGIVERGDNPPGTLTAFRKEFREATDGRGWRTLNDVTIFTVNQDNKTGPLTVGYGVGPDRIGAEFSFGIQLYDRYREKFLIIKTNWGGQSLGAEFRPPSAIRKRGNPQGKSLVRIPGGDNAGVRYRDILDTVRRVTKNISSIVPNYDTRAGYEIAAFAWHQGWNDACDFDHELDDPRNMANEYEKNLADFIVDMRQSLQSEFQVVNDLPFILGSCGHAGSPGNHRNEGKFGDFVERGLRMIWSAYDSVGTSGRFGRVLNVDSVPFARSESQSPGSQGFHWWENAETYYRLGKAMGDAAILAIDGAPGPSPRPPSPTPPSPPPSPSPPSGGGFEDCVRNCQRLGHCCSNPSSSSNQFMSCSQACKYRDTGASRTSCRSACLLPRSCGRSIGGLYFGLCGDCRPDAGCPHGVPNTTACLDGCAF